MVRIIPNLWLNRSAEEAVDFYTRVFPESRIVTISRYPQEGLLEFQEPLAGEVLAIDFDLWGTRFTAINADDTFTPNPSLSFTVRFSHEVEATARRQLDALWEHLAEGGQVLMPRHTMPYSPYYGWVQDRFGISWQLLIPEPGAPQRPPIMPHFMFAEKAQNRGAEALTYYLETFRDSELGIQVNFPAPQGPATKDSVMYSELRLADTWFGLMDSAVEQPFSFNEAVSLAVLCKDQAEIDHLWQRLSAEPEAELCGWCQDRFGVSWQILPENIEELMAHSTGYHKVMNMKKNCDCGSGGLTVPALCSQTTTACQESNFSWQAVVFIRMCALQL